MNWWVITIGLSAGAAVAVQFAVNSQLKIATGNPLWASLISFLVGTAGLMVTIVVQRIPLPTVQGLSSAPAWAWMGGLCGAFYVYTAILLLPRIGVAALAGLAVTGQMLAALVLDHYGLFRVPVNPFSWTRLIGAALMVFGLLLIRTK
jgi:transporter family-2 protein